MTTVTSQRKGELLAGDFDRVSRGYDLLCKLNPGYHKHLWCSARRLELTGEARVLDLCCGSGLSTVALRTELPQAQLVGLDASVGMLEQAAAKPGLRDVEWVHADATDPAAAGVEGPFDGILMAYGIRNVPDPDRCLRNLHDLLAPGGRLVLHEYSVADSRRSQAVWNAITLGVVIPLGLAVTGSSTIFRYLRRSVLEFDGVRALCARLAAAGFEDVRVLPMDGWQRGVVHSFVARRR